MRSLPQTVRQIDQPSSKLIKHPTLKIYPGASHGIADTHKDQLNADLLAFLKT